VRRRYVISGRVQAVGFRWFARATASRLGILGWVRNLPSHQVEAEGQGSPEALESFETELRRGPPGAQVTEFAVSEISDETNSASGFVIR
jgi:acylphosphatase